MPGAPAATSHYGGLGGPGRNGEDHGDGSSAAGWRESSSRAAKSQPEWIFSCPELLSVSLNHTQTTGLGGIMHADHAHGAVSSDSLPASST